jgi:hypothetical protein
MEGARVSLSKPAMLIPANAAKAACWQIIAMAKRAGVRRWFRE